MSPLTAVLIAVIAIVFSAFFSGSEIAYVQSNKVRVEIDASQGGVVNRLIRRFSRHEEMFISSLLVGNNIVLVIYGIAVSSLINPPLESIMHNEALVLIANTIISTSIILLSGEFLPKTAFRINPNLAMRMVALPLYAIYLLLYPIAWIVTKFSKLMMRIFHVAGNQNNSGTLTIDQLDDYIEQTLDANTQGSEVQNEVKIFRNAIDFKDTTISECMIPRNEIIAVDLHKTTRQLLVKKFIATGLSKIVVFDKDIDDIVGYIHLAELFDPEADWTKCIKPVIFTPQTMLANKMMRRMLAEKRSLVIVIDEFGGTAGLVTMEDLVEEIFGEIQDEHDRENKTMLQTSPGMYLLSGRAEIDEINEMFHLDLKESDEYETIAGYLLNHLGEMPKEGESYQIEGMTFTVDKMTATKIQTITLQVMES